MNFPSFILTGPAAEMPVAPISYPMLNLMPAVQALRKEKTSGSPSKKGDDSKIDIDATRGQAEQWQRNYDSVMSKMNAIVAYEGEDAIKNPVYKRLVNELAVYESPGMKQVLKRNRESQDKFIANIAEQDASGAIHLGMGLSGHGFYTMDDWRAMQENAETTGAGTVALGSRPFIENFESDFKVVGMKQVGEELRSILATAGSSEVASATASNRIEEFAKGNLSGLLKTYNKSMIEQKSNYDAFNERGDKGPTSGSGAGRGTGQLGWAAYGTAWKRAGFEGLDITDPINNGLLQSFAQKTLGKVKSGDPELANSKQAFWNRADSHLSKEEIEDRNKRLDGYYYKKGVKDENGRDMEGEIDMEAMLNDYLYFSMGVIDNEYNTHKQTTYRNTPDEQLTFYNENPEQTKIGYAKREADIFGMASHQSEDAIAVTTDQGYDANQLKDIFGGEDANGVMKVVNEALASSGFDVKVNTDSNDNESLLSASTMQGSFSPFETIVGSDGNVRYIPKADWSGEDATALRENIEKTLKNKNPNWTSSDVESEADKIMLKVTNAHNKAMELRYHESNFGLERAITTVLNWSVDKVNPELKEQISKSYFDMKGPNGEILFKPASLLFENVDVKFGETVAEGRGLLGNIPLVSVSNALTLAAYSVPKNAGMIANENITIGGKTYKKGNFIHLKELDALSKEKADELINGGRVTIGSGYWNLNANNVYVDNQRPDRTENFGIGNTSLHVLKKIYSPDSQNAQNIAQTPSQYYTDGTFGGEIGMVKKELKGKKFTIDVPQYMQSAVGMEAYRHAEKVSGTSRRFDSYGQKGSGRSSFDKEKYASDLGLTGKLKEDFLRESAGKSERSIIELGGKYYGSLKYKEKADWSMKPVMHNIDIIDANGNVDERFKRQTNWNEKNGNAYFTGKVNVTGALQATTDRTVRQSAFSGYNAWYNAGQKTAEQPQQKGGLNPNIKPKGQTNK